MPLRPPASGRDSAALRRPEDGSYRAPTSADVTRTPAGRRGRWRRAGRPPTPRTRPTSRGAWSRGCGTVRLAGLLVDRDSDQPATRRWVERRAGRSRLAERPKRTVEDALVGAATPRPPPPHDRAVSERVASLRSADRLDRRSGTLESMRLVSNGIVNRVMQVCGIALNSWFWRSPEISISRRCDFSAPPFEGGARWGSSTGKVRVHHRSARWQGRAHAVGRPEKPTHRHRHLRAVADRALPRWLSPRTWTDRRRGRGTRPSDGRSTRLRP